MYSVFTLARWFLPNLFGIRRDLILYALIVLGTILPIIAALFRNLIQKNDQLNTVLVDLELSNDNLRQSQLELQHNLSQMEELTQEKGIISAE